MTEAPAAPRRDRFPILLGAAVVAVLVAVGAAGLRSWQDLVTQRSREAELEGDIARTEADVRRLEERIERLQDDPLTLERLARHDLGMVRPDDVVFVFPESLSGRPGPSRARPVPAAPPAPVAAETRAAVPGSPSPPAAPPSAGADANGLPAPAATPAASPAPGPAAAAPAPPAPASRRAPEPVAPATPSPSAAPAPPSIRP
jgi:cell division protein FtsB